MSSKYVVYKHTNIIDGKVYIGITNKVTNLNKRWLNGKGYEHNSYFSAAIAKYGWENFHHEIIDEANTQEEINQKEKYWIAYYQTTDRNKGYNLTQGGEGIWGFSHTEETKKKIGLANGKPVLCLETGAIFNSASEADRAIGATAGCVSQAILHKGTALGKHWIYYTGECLSKEARDSLIQSMDSKQYTVQRKKVLCVETNVIYNSVMEANRKTGINNRNIGSCCNGKRERAGGYHWQWV